MRSLLLTLVIILSIAFNLAAQVPEGVPREAAGDPPPIKKPFAERLVFGGYLGAQFGTNTYVNISPIIGYRVTDKFTTGIGITYIYYKYDYYTGYGNTAYSEQDHIFGTSLWAEYRVIPQVFLHAEPGLLNLSVLKTDNLGYYTGETYRKNIYTFLVGGGYYAPIGQNSGMQFSILWDLIQDPNSPYYGIPVVRIGFSGQF